MSTSKLSLYFSITIILVCSVLLAQSQNEKKVAKEEESGCLRRIGGAAKILDKKLVHKEPYNQATEYLESNLKKPYRIIIPSEPIETLDPEFDRISVTVDEDNFVTDVECF